MIENIVIVVVVVVLLIAAFFIGVCAGVGGTLDICEKERQQSDDLYCFECEVDMPFKEKDGRFYCTNCNLYH